MTIDGQRLIVPDLIRDPAPGEVSLNTSTGYVRFANFVIRPGADPGFTDDPGAPVVEAEEGTVPSWRISESFPEDVVDGVLELPASAQGGHDWATVAADNRGIANTAKARNRLDGNTTVFAAVTLRSGRAQTVRVRIGFSDRVRAFLDGKQVLAETDDYGTRDYRFLGTIGLFDELFLPLKAGDDDVWLAVSETFGGWGVTMQIPEGQGVTAR